MSFAYTLSGPFGSEPVPASGGARGWMGGRSAWAGGAVTGGAFQTTAATTAAGLTIAIAKHTAKKMRTGRDRTMRTMTSLVRQVFELGRELAHPTTIVQPSDEAAVPLVASHVQELLLCYQRPKAGQVRICAVPHDRRPRRPARATALPRAVRRNRRSSPAGRPSIR